MTLAGTRPILQDELRQYELHHRARIAIKPGITGMLGFDFISSNKGCEALTYTFLSMMERICDEKKLYVYNFTYNKTLGRIPEQFPEIEFKQCNINLKNPRYWKNAFKLLKT